MANVIKMPETKALQEQVRREGFDQALQKLHGAAVEGADAWIRSLEAAAKRGNHKSARDLLLHLGIIEPVDRGMGGVTIQIGVPLSEVRIGGEDTNDGVVIPVP